MPLGFSYLRMNAPSTGILFSSTRLEITCGGNCKPVTPFYQLPPKSILANNVLGELSGKADGIMKRPEITTQAKELFGSWMFRIVQALRNIICKGENLVQTAKHTNQ